MFGKFMGKSKKSRQMQEEKPILGPLPEEMQEMEAIVTKQERYSEHNCSVGREYAILTSCEGDRKKVVVPAVWNGKPVKELRYLFIAKDNLKEVVISEGIEVLGKRTFEYCSNIESLTLPSSLRKIEVDAFSREVKIKTLHWSPHPDCVVEARALHCFFDQLDENNCLVLDGMLVAKTYNGNRSILSEGVTHICVGSFLESMAEVEFPSTLKAFPFWKKRELMNLSKLTLHGPTPITVIPRGIFSDQLKGRGNNQVHLGEGVERIEEKAFQNTGITQIHLPQSLKYIGANAFTECTKLREISIPKEVNFIGNHAFSNCTSLESIVFEGGGKSNFKNSLFLFRRNLYRAPRWLVESWGLEEQSSFYLNQFSHWEKLTEEEKEGLGECLLLKKTLVEELESVDYLSQKGGLLCQKLFDQCVLDQIALYLSFAPLEKIGQVDYFLEKSIEKQETEVTAMLLEYKRSHFSPEEVEEYEERKELVAAGLERPTLQELKERWKLEPTKTGCVVVEAYLGTDGDELLVTYTENHVTIEGFSQRYGGFRGLTSLSIQGWMEKIGGYFPDLQSIRLPKNLKTVEDEAFCRSALEEVKIPDSVRIIGNDAFRECPDLVRVVLPKELYFFGMGAFSNCPSLKEVCLRGDVEKLGRGAFRGCPSLEFVGEEHGRNQLDTLRKQGIVAKEGS